MIDLIKGVGFWWFDMTDSLLDILSNCPCAKLKVEAKPKPYTKKKPIVAEYPMHIFCIYLYNCNSEQYLTGIDVFSKFGYRKAHFSSPSSTAQWHFGKMAQGAWKDV